MFYTLSCSAPALFDRILFVRVFGFGRCRNQVSVGFRTINDGFNGGIVACKFFDLKQIKIQLSVATKRVVVGSFNLVAVDLSVMCRDVAFALVQRVLNAGRCAFVLYQTKGISKHKKGARGDSSDNITPLVTHFVDNPVAFVDDDFPLTNLRPAPGKEAFAQVGGYRQCVFLRYLYWLVF